MWTTVWNMRYCTILYNLTLRKLVSATCVLLFANILFTSIHSVTGVGELIQFTWINLVGWSFLIPSAFPSGFMHDLHKMYQMWGLLTVMCECKHQSKMLHTHIFHSFVVTKHKDLKVKNMISIWNAFVYVLVFCVHGVERKLCCGALLIKIWCWYAKTKSSSQIQFSNQPVKVKGIFGSIPLFHNIALLNRKH